MHAQRRRHLRQRRVNPQVGDTVWQTDQQNAMARLVWVRWFPPGGGSCSLPAFSLACILRLNPIRLLLELIVKSLPWEVAWCVGSGSRRRRAEGGGGWLVGS